MIYDTVALWKNDSIGRDAKDEGQPAPLENFITRNFAANTAMKRDTTNWSSEKVILTITLELHLGKVV